MDYKGWTLYDEITLVIKKEKNQYRGYEFPQAYIVNPKDKKQLQTAINWGKYANYFISLFQPYLIIITYYIYFVNTYFQLFLKKFNLFLL